MEQSDTIELLVTAMVKAQSQMESAEKNKVNPHLKNKYADLSSVLDATTPALNANGLWLGQWFERMDGSNVLLTTQLSHVSGQWMRSTGSFPVAKMDAQGTAGGSTYLSRYSIKRISGLPDEDDDGNAASKKPAEKMASVEQCRILADKREAVGLLPIAMHVLPYADAVQMLADLKIMQGKLPKPPLVVGPFAELMRDLDRKAPPEYHQAPADEKLPS